MTESLENYYKRLEFVRWTYPRAIIKGYDILLEYSESQKCFHFNYLVNGELSDTPSPYFMPIGYTNENMYKKFKESLKGQRPSIDDMIKLFAIFYKTSYIKLLKLSRKD